MGLRGPQPKPSALLKLSGSVATNRDAVVIPPGIPAPPAWLDGDALRVWGETVAVLGSVPGLLTLADRNALAAACIAQAMVERFYGQADDPSDPVRQVNAAKVLKDWLETSARLWAKFGCSPADRVRTSASKKASDAPSGLAKFAKHG